MKDTKRTCAVLTVLLLMTLVIPSLSLSGCGTSNAEVTAKPRGGEVTRYDKGYRFDSNGWTFIHIEGEPYERGFQHGRLVAGELAEIEKYLRYTTPIDNGQDWDYFVKAAETLFTQNKDEECLQEIKGIADGARSAGTDITWQEVLAWNGNTELTGYWYPGVLAGDYKAGNDKTHCSAFIATGSYTRGSKVVMAHNDWDHFVNGQYANVVLEIKPSKGHRIIMQSMPGYISSMTDFFANDAGIMGTETTIGAYDSFDPSKLAEFYRMRKATQYANNLDEWVNYMMQKNNGGYANSWLLADYNTGEIMRFELALQNHSITRTKDGFYIGFNSAIDPKIRNLECGGDLTFFDTRTPMGARRVRLTQLINQNRGVIDTDVAKKILADHYDVYLRRAHHPCSRTIDGHYELDPFQYWQARRPYSPQGAVDGKVMDSDMAKDLSFVARWGNSSGMPFNAEKFFKNYPQWDYLEGYIKDRPTRQWTRFQAGAQ